VNNARSPERRPLTAKLPGTLFGDRLPVLLMTWAVRNSYRKHHLRLRRTDRIQLTVAAVTISLQSYGQHAIA
jgi:hypothetical protein